jgi:hypothetical protein
VGAVSIGLFEEQLKGNLHKLWNRMSSGSYFPGPVRGVEIPKDHGEGACRFARSRCGWHSAVRPGLSAIRYFVAAR